MAYDGDREELDMDANGPKPVAWLRFGVDGPDAIFLSDRWAWSERHRRHTWYNRGTIVGSDDRSQRYLVACVPLETTELRPCEICDEPNALIVGDGVGNILYTGPDLEAAERAFEEAFN
jgi:hypothetical protein